MVPVAIPTFKAFFFISIESINAMMPKLTALKSRLKLSYKCANTMLYVHFLMIRRFIQTSKWGVLKCPQFQGKNTISNICTQMIH